MEEKKPKAILDIMAADEIHDFFKAKRAVNEDEELCEYIKNYEEKAKLLTQFLEGNEEYDAAYALELANQVDLLAGYLEGNPKVNALKLAYDVMNRYLQSVKTTVTDSGDPVASFSCDGLCSQCKGECTPADLLTKK